MIDTTQVLSTMFVLSTQQKNNVTCYVYKHIYIHGKSRANNKSGYSNIRTKD